MSSSIKYRPGTGFGDLLGPVLSSSALREWLAEQVGSGYYAEGFEVFHHPRHYQLTTEEGTPLKEGWYWCPCRPGCPPDGDEEPLGPFENAARAARDAKTHDDEAATSTRAGGGAGSLAGHRGPGPRRESQAAAPAVDAQEMNHRQRVLQFGYFALFLIEGKELDSDVLEQLSNEAVRLGLMKLDSAQLLERTWTW